MTGLTETVARFVHEKTSSDLPQGAVDKAKRAIADTFAVILAGAGSELAAPLERYLELAGARGDAPVLGTPHTASPEIAALLNGAFGHALDFDDVLSLMPAHPSAVILAALCASLGRETISGMRLIEAYALGIEIGGRIGSGVTVGHYHRGFHGTGTLGIFSALAALAKLRRLDVATTRTAFGIGASLASGLQRNFGTMTKALHTGWAARSALAAVDLASLGFTAARDVLEAKAGFFAAYGTADSDPAAGAAALGNPWVLIDPGLALKRFPCCYAAHRGMDAVLALKARHGFAAEDIEHLTCAMPPGGMRALIHPRPKSGLEGKFSLPYALAAGVLDGRYGLRSFTDEAVQRPAIARLLERIEAREDPRCAGDDPAFESLSPGSRGFVEVEVVLKNGVRDISRVDRPPGHPSRELTWGDIEAKFADCAAHACMPQAHASRAFSRLRHLESLGDMATLIDLLRKR
ncbi:MAG TPA: MmgE/PrpD family protein [Burkholderiales bacterium]|nr:MmgE/PrpD family protein [Burkholderiales bacterium]